MKTSFLLPCLLLLTFLSMKGICQNTKNVQTGVQLQIRVLLQGAMADSNGPLMRDDLRTNGYLPASEPYAGLSNFEHVGGGGEAAASHSVFQTTGENAIVDWVFIELRNPADPKIVVATRSALLQRDGDVVETDGVSPVLFQSVASGKYHVAVRHRNHLGVMTANAFELGKTLQSIDFSDPDFPTYGLNAQAPAGERVAMWGGNANRDKHIIARGPNNDSFYIFSKVLSATGNTSFARNFIYTGYHQEDINLDGKVIYEGPDSDYAYLLFKIVLPWTVNCPGINLACFITEQLP